MHTIPTCPPKQLRRRYYYVRQRDIKVGMSRAELLRDPESNRGLKVMSLARYLFSIPLYNLLTILSKDYRKKPLTSISAIVPKIQNFAMRIE
jgi:hypothetical protein